MIIPHQVQYTVNEKLIKAFLQTDSRWVCFPARCLHRYHHITEKVGSQLDKLTFTHWKGDYVGRTFSVEILQVYLLDLLVINQQDGKLCLRTVQGV